MPRVLMLHQIYDWLDAHGGDGQGFVDRMTHGQRIGQAFFNSLSKDHQNRCTGTTFDPFYSDERHAVQVAIERLGE